METGTGKTYVYTKVIYELHKRYRRPCLSHGRYHREEHGENMCPLHRLRGSLKEHIRRYSNHPHKGLENILAINDDDGVNGQFRIEYYLEEGQTVYLLPIRYDWGDSCDYTVTVKKCIEPLDVYSIEEFDATISIDPAKEVMKTGFNCNSSTAYVKINAYDTVDDSSETVTYSIDLELDPNEAEYEIVLYDGSGSAIISVNKNSVVKSVNFTVFSDCTYIKITRLDGEAIGDATLEYTYLGRYSSGGYR